MTGLKEQIGGEKNIKGLEKQPPRVEKTGSPYKYSHENLCKGNLAERPVKPHTKPKAKPTPKPEPAEIQTPAQSSINPTQSSINPKVASTNPLMSHYQLLQQQYMQQKQERLNILFQGMVSGSRKKR